MKYKLIKEYPGSPKLNDIVIQDLYYKDLYIVDEINVTEKWKIYNCENYPEFWEKIVEKDYEILSLILNNNYCFLDKDNLFKYKDHLGAKYGSTLQECLNIKWKIHSVKRLSDSQIFTIGDKIGILGNIYPIAEFKISNIENTILISSYYENGRSGNYNTRLKDLEHSKIPLFKSEDGIDIFDGDDIYMIDKFDYLLSNGIVNNKDFGCNKLRFSSKEKAEECVLLNKPCLSYGEVQEYLKVKDCNKVLNLIQEKLK